MKHLYYLTLEQYYRDGYRYEHPLSREWLRQGEPVAFVDKSWHVCRANVKRPASIVGIALADCRPNEGAFIAGEGGGILMVGQNGLPDGAVAVDGVD